MVQTCGHPDKIRSIHNIKEATEVARAATQEGQGTCPEKPQAKKAEIQAMKKYWKYINHVLAVVCVSRVERP